MGITHTDPTYPQNPPTTHLKWPFLHFMMFYTIQTIYFLKAGDTHYPMTHCPLPHHLHRPTLHKKSTHNSHNMTIFPFYDVLHYTNHIFSESFLVFYTTQTIYL